MKKNSQTRADILFSYLGSKSNLHSHTEISSMLSVSYTEKGNQTLLNFCFSLNFSKTLNCWYVKHIMVLLFCFFHNALPPHLHPFQLFRLFHDVHYFIIDKLSSLSLSSSFFFPFSEMSSNFRI